VAVKDRQERIALEPAGLTLADGDYIYSEYLDRSCLADSNPFIHSKLKCEPGPAENLAAEAGTLSAAQERAQILKMFSSGD
jgi:penicillin-binding protein 1A